MIIRTRSIAALAGLATVACATSASAVIIADTSVATEAGLLASNGLVPLDLSGLIGGLTTNNSYTQNFASPVPGAYTGTMSVEVYGNVSVPGLALNQVLMVYTMTGDGPNGLDEFQLGVDSSTNIDYNDLLASVHGTILDTTTGGQTSPQVELLNNAGTNNTYTFDYLTMGDTLGNPGGAETLSWYVLSNADVAIDFVDVTITDFGAVTIQSLSLVDVPGLPDLNVPTPGAAVVLSLAGIAGLRRRR